MKKLLYLTASLGVLSSVYGSNEFRWTDNKSDLTPKVAAIRAEALSLRTHFPEESRAILSSLDTITTASSAEAALAEVERTIREKLTWSGSAPKVLEKYIPAETRVERTATKYVIKDKEVYSGDSEVEKGLRYWREKLYGKQNIEVHELKRICVGWILWWNLYRIIGSYTEHTQEEVVVRASRTERRSLSDVLTAFQQMEGIIRREQGRLRRERQRREAAERERQRQEAAARAERERLAREAAARAERERLAREAAARAEATRREAEMRGLTADQLTTLGFNYFSGTNGKPRDQAHARTLYQRAAEAGSATAVYNLGIYAFYGCGGETRSRDAAKAYFERAYRAGYKTTPTNTTIKAVWEEATHALREAERLAQEAAARAERERLAQEEAARAEAERARREAEELERQRQEELARQQREAAARAERERQEAESTVEEIITLTNPLTWSAEETPVAEATRIVRGIYTPLTQSNIPLMAASPTLEIVEDPVEAILAKVAELGWEKDMFWMEREAIPDENVDDLKAFDAAVRRLYHLQLKASDPAHDVPLQDILSEGSALRSDWIERLNQFIQTQVFHSHVIDRDDATLIAELLRMNPSVTGLIETELHPRLMAVHHQFNNLVPEELRFGPQSFATLNINEWTAEDVTTWCNHFRRLEVDRKQSQLNVMLAVIMQAAKLKHGYTPRSTQLLSTLAQVLPNTDSGRFLQIATGEGKSLITAMTAAVWALLGKKVDVASSSGPLSQRDAAEQKAFYELLSLSCGDVASEDSTVVQAGYQCDVVYGTVHMFSGHTLSQEFQGRRSRGDRSYEILLTDEVDSLLVDQIDVFTQLSQPMPGMETLLPILTLLRNALAEQLEPPEDSLTPVASMSQIHQNLLTYGQALLQAPPEGLIIPEHLKRLAHYQLPLWIESVIRARLEHQQDCDHIVNANGDIRPIDYQHTGVVHTNQVFSDGRQQFLQLNSHSYITAESLLGSFMSPLSYVKRYGSNLFGVTGTLGNASTKGFMQQVYGVDFIEMPTYKPKQFKEYVPEVSSSQTQWKDSILQSIEDETSSGRPVLVLLETKAQLDSVKAALAERSPDLTVFTYCRNDLTESELEQDASQALPDELQKGQVILTTNLAGRGTDIKLPADVDEVGGLHVCLTFMPLNERIEAQNFGRTARQGKKGTAQLLACSAHFVDAYRDFETHKPYSIQRIRDVERVLQQQQKLNASVAYNLPDGAMQDALFTAVQSKMKALRGG